MQFNSSWTLNRDFGVLGAFDGKDNNIVTYAEIHNNAFDGMPGKIVTTFKDSVLAWKRALDSPELIKSQFLSFQVVTLFKAEDRSQDANIGNKVLTYDIAIDDRHALSASASYDETDEDYSISMLEFTNDLVEGRD